MDVRQVEWATATTTTKNFAMVFNIEKEYVLWKRNSKCTVPCVFKGMHAIYSHSFALFSGTFNGIVYFCMLRIIRKGYSTQQDDIESFWTMTRECEMLMMVRVWREYEFVCVCLHNWPDVNSYVWHFNECLLLFQHCAIFQTRNRTLFVSSMLYYTSNIECSKSRQKGSRYSSLHYFNSVRQRWTVIIFVFYGIACVFSVLLLFSEWLSCCLGCSIYIHGWDGH